MGVEDTSFVTPGSIPFKWEIRPGVPKIHHHTLSPSPFDHQVDPNDLSPSFLGTPQKLKPPPAGYPELRTRPFLPDSRRNRILKPEIVSQGCFSTASVLRQNNNNKRKVKKKPKFEPGPGDEPEPDYYSDLGTLARWSVSSPKSFCMFYGSPLSSSFSSYGSSPRPVSDAEWGGFGLF